ncbi:MAG: hypothetical protein M3396_08200 [Actinomycetota bacterium]|nr:hypothetical protein [Actinomycetota bacterium]
MNAGQMGEAGLQGWRTRVADRVAPAVSRRTPFDVNQVRKAIGAAFLGLSLLYLVKAARELVRR